MPADPQMLHSFDFLRGRQVRMGARNLRHLVSEPGEFLRKREPDFLDRTAHERRNGKKRAQNNRDLHLCKVVILKVARRSQRIPRLRLTAGLGIPRLHSGCQLLSRMGLQDTKHRIYRTIDFEMVREAKPRVGRHFTALQGWSREPAFDQASRSRDVVFRGKTAGVVHDLAPDIDLVRNENRRSAGKRFDDRDPKVLLMRRQNKGFRCGEGAPLRFPVNMPENVIVLPRSSSFVRRFSRRK